MKEFIQQLSNDSIEITASSLPAPVITYLVQERTWRLEAPYTCQHEVNRITVPDQFEFDLASVPRLFWWLIAPFELSIAAPLLHDFLYHYGGELPDGSVIPSRSYSREEADLLFRDMMEQEGVSPWRRAAAYRAVRWLGSGAWSAGA